MTNSHVDGQNWESFAHEVDERYAKCGGLAERLDALDADYDTVSAAELKRTKTLDDMVKTTLRDAFAATESLFERELIYGIANAVWNGARRANGYAEMAVLVAPTRDGSKPPFNTMAAAWAFAEEARHISIGIGPIASFVAETTDAALAIGRAQERAGRDRNGAGGFLPAERMSSSPTHVGGSHAKNEARVIMRDDVLQALDRSVEDVDIPLLALVVLGEQRRVPAARTVGENRRRPQFERVRLTYREAARWAVGHGDTDSEEAIRQRIGRAKDAFRRALEARHLIPIQVERAPRSRRTVDRFAATDRAEREAGR